MSLGIFQDPTPLLLCVKRTVRIHKGCSVAGIARGLATAVIFRRNAVTTG